MFTTLFKGIALILEAAARENVASVLEVDGPMDAIKFRDFMETAGNVAIWEAVAWIPGRDHVIHVLSIYPEDPTGKWDYLKEETIPFMLEYSL